MNKKTIFRSNNNSIINNNKNNCTNGDLAKYFKALKESFSKLLDFYHKLLSFIKHKMRIIPELQFHNCGVHYKSFLITILVQRLRSHLEGYRLYITSQVSVPAEPVTRLVLCLGIQIVRDLQLQQLRRKYDDSTGYRLMPESVALLFASIILKALWPRYRTTSKVD